jgi:hypothetical protein
MTFAKPTWGYSCPAQNVVVFVGDSEDEHDIETHFSDTKTIEDVQRVSKEHRYKIWKFEQTEFYEYVIFEQSGSKMQPAVWMNFLEKAYEYESVATNSEMVVDFGTNVFI